MLKRTMRSAGPLLLLFCAVVFGQSVPQSPYEQGTVAFEAHDYAKAAALFGKAASVHPEQSDALLYEGKSLAHLGRFGEAEAVLRRYAAEHPNSAETFYILGYVLNREDKPADSLKTYTKAARLSVPKSDDLKVVGLDYVLLNDYPDAIRWLQQAVQFDPQNEEAWYGLGRCYYTEGELGDAEKAFLRALELDPQDAKAESNLALTYEMENLLTKAEQAYKKSIAMAEPGTMGDEWPYLNYGSFLLEHNQSAEAVPLLEKAAAIAPKCAECLGKLGWALVRSGNLQKAIVELQKAIALSPKDPKLHYNLGRAYRAAGDMDAARAEMATSAKLYGTTASAATK